MAEEEMLGQEGLALLNLPCNSVKHTEESLCHSPSSICLVLFAYCR